MFAIILFVSFLDTLLKSRTDLRSVTSGSGYGGYVYRKCVEISLKFRRKLLFVKDCIAVVLFNKSGITLH